MKSTTVRFIPDSLWTSFRQAALAQQLTVNDAMIMAIRQFVDGCVSPDTVSGVSTESNGSEDSKREERS